MGILQIDTNGSLLSGILIALTTAYISWSLRSIVRESQGHPHYRSPHGLDSYPAQKKKGIPIDALETFYDNTEQGLRASSETLMRTFFLCSPEGLNLLKHRLASYDLDERWEAINVLAGIVVQKSEDRFSLFDIKQFIAAIMYGLFESLESDVAHLPKAAVHRRRTIKILHAAAQSAGHEEILLLCVKYGFTDYILELQKYHDSNPSAPCTFAELLKPESKAYEPELHTMGLVLRYIDKHNLNITLAESPAWGFFY